MALDFTPYLHLALNGNAEENRNWAILDSKALDLARNLIANIPAGGDLTGFYPDPLIGDLKVTDAKIASVSWSKITGAPPAGGGWTDDPANQILKTTNPRHLQMANNRTFFFGDPLTAGNVMAQLQPSGTGLIVRGKSNVQLRTDAGTVMLTVTDTGVSAPTVILDPFAVPAALEGEIAYQGGHFQGRNATAWVNLDDAGGGAPSGPAGGSLFGTYPNPTLAANAVLSANITDLNVTGAKIAGAAVTTDKLSPAPALPADVGKFITVGAGGVFAYTTAAGGAPSGPAGGDLGSSYPNPTVVKAAGNFSIGAAGDTKLTLGTGTLKAHLDFLPGFPYAYFSQNTAWNGSAWVRDDATKIAWRMLLRGNTDDVRLTHTTAAGVDADVLMVDGAGNAALGVGTQITLGPAATPRITINNDGPNGISTFAANYSYAPEDATKASWSMKLRATADIVEFTRRAPGDASSGGTALLTLSGASILDLVPAVSGNPILRLTGNGSTGYGGMLIGRHSQGTAAAPTPTALNNTLLDLEGWGCYTAGSYGTGGYAILQAAEAWTNTTRGTKWVFGTTPVGAVGATSTMTFDGAGNLTAAGFFQSGSAVFRCRSNATADLCTNDPSTPGYNSSFPSWMVSVQHSGADGYSINRRAVGQGTYNTVPLAVDAAGNLTIAGGTATKASGTTWANPSDRRLKDEIADYPTGLEAIKQLMPRTFLYNGLGGSQAGTRGYGFIADEVAPVMPEMVGSYSTKEADTDVEYQTVDQSNLILALVNAVKELASRVATLESSR